MKKPSQSVRTSTKAIPDLTNFTEGELLQATVDIGAKSGEKVTPEQQAMLKAIQQEFKRRENLLLFPAKVEGGKKSA
jgi:hypothetical protein